MKKCVFSEGLSRSTRAELGKQLSDCKMLQDALQALSFFPRKVYDFRDTM
jgi:hypothetical protein